MFLQFLKGSDGNVIDDYWVLKDVSKGVSRVCFMGVSKVFYGGIKIVTREFQGVSRGCKRCFKSLSGVFQVCVVDVTRVYHGCIKGVKG